METFWLHPVRGESPVRFKMVLCKRKGTRSLGETSEVSTRPGLNLCRRKYPGSGTGHNKHDVILSRGRPLEGKMTPAQE